MSLNRKAHFLGTKIRNLRKRNNLTMEDLSARCIKVNASSAPSVSYLSMIERGKRVPSEDMLEVIASVFQKPTEWFLDDVSTDRAVNPVVNNKGGLTGIALEPSFLFGQDILQIAIPELLSQSGTTGEQFAHILIRAFQERHQNHFPDLERAAESIGKKRMNLNVEDLLSIGKSMGLEVKNYTSLPDNLIEEISINDDQMVSSFSEGKTLYVNKALHDQPERFKYDLAVNIGHHVLHPSETSRRSLLRGRNLVGSKLDLDVDSQGILEAWQGFESRFFAGALLLPKVAYRQLLDSTGYDILTGFKASVSISTGMRRMTAVSPYPHWHYFDAYHPGKLKAVYRGNGIPLPWGNMREVDDPCQHWAVFRMINQPKEGTSAQISIMEVNGAPRIYCCESVNSTDLVANNHVLCVGIDLNPAIEAHNGQADEIAQELREACVRSGGSASIPTPIAHVIKTVGKILNIAWIERGLEREARLICARGAVCPRVPSCYASR